MRIIGILAAHNEELFIESCLKHHLDQGIELYLVDNESTDGTVTIAQKYLGQGLVGIESLPRRGVFDWSAVLRRKQELASTLDADWFMHLDADEMRLPPEAGQTLAQAIETVDQARYNAVNFLEFTFIPTLESPDHAHPHFKETMRWYYPFLPRLLHRVNAWKKQPAPVDLVKYGGHFVKFPQQFIYPVSFHMRHYQFLSVAHAEIKYAHRRYSLRELAQGKHGWREQLDTTKIRLPSRYQLNEVKNDSELDFSHPRSIHFIDNQTENLNKPQKPLRYLIQSGAARFFRCLRSGGHAISDY